MKDDYQKVIDFFNLVNPEKMVSTHLEYGGFREVRVPEYNFIGLFDEETGELLGGNFYVPSSE